MARAVAVAGALLPVAGGRLPVAGYQWPVARGLWPVAGGRWPWGWERCPRKALTTRKDAERRCARRASRDRAAPECGRRLQSATVSLPPHRSIGVFWTAQGGSNANRDDMDERTVGHYTTTASERTSAYERVDVSGMHELMLRCFGSGSRLLEIGCGSGHDAAFLAVHGRNVTATDASEGMIAAARWVHPETAGQFHRLPFPFPRFSWNRFDCGSMVHYCRSSIPAKPLRKHAQMWRVFPFGKAYER